MPAICSDKRFSYQFVSFDMIPMTTYSLDSFGVKSIDFDHRYITFTESFERLLAKQLLAQ